ncbi:MAG: cytochrome c maturation protein CcmE [Candidatus Promineifilaceae bacterium]
MAQPTWTADEAGLLETDRPNRLKFIIAGGLILVAVIFLITQALSSEGQFFITVQEYHENPAKYGQRDFRISAWVDGDTIKFTQIDDQTSRLEFDIVDNLANPTSSLHVVAMNQEKPDLLQHEAQAIVVGSIGEDGAMYANDDGLLLKCPTRYEEGETGLE